MNQILSVNNNPDDRRNERPSKKEKKPKAPKQPRNSGPVEIASILKFFAISLLVFGIFLIGSGSYGMYKASTTEVANSKPVIYVERLEESKMLLKVSSYDKPLSKVNYSWNDEQSTEVPCNGQKEVETTIEMPSGTNSLLVYAVDANGHETKYPQTYTVEADIGIEIEPDGNNIKIKVDGKNQLSFMTYRWDEEEEKKVEIGATTAEETVEIPKGLHTLTVVVVDENNKSEEKQQEVNGVTKPKLEITTDGSDNFVMHASDEQGLSKLEFTLNGKKNKLDLEKAIENVEDRKEFEYSFPFEQGENTLKVTIYNINGVSESKSVKVNI